MYEEPTFMRLRDAQFLAKPILLFTAAYYFRSDNIIINIILYYRLLLQLPTRSCYQVIIVCITRLEQYKASLYTYVGNHLCEACTNAWVVFKWWTRKLSKVTGNSTSSPLKTWSNERFWVTINKIYKLHAFSRCNS